jgi:transposase
MHQAVAARCHAARHARTRSQATNERVILPTALARAALTDAEWARVRPVLPPQQPRTGRPRHDHRMVLNGILTVVGTELSWREIPEAYGKWETAYKRYRLWCDTGLWQRIVTALGERTQK